jgi:hypothetical protein
MDVTPEEILYRQQYNGWTLWCRQFSYRSYRNVYAVYLWRRDGQCHQEVHRVRGVLGNGSHFAGYLIKSQARKHALAAISDKFSSGLSKQTRGGHWVIVEASSAEAALAHEDTEVIRKDMMRPGVGHVFCGVYFISNGKGAVKIGQTASNISIRLAQLQGASPYRLKVCALIDSSDQKRLERELHKSLKDCRLEGEWFEMTEKQAVEIAVSHGGRPARLYSPRTNLKPKCST